MSPNELPPGYLPPLGYYPQYPGQPTGGDPFTLPPPIPRERYSTGMMVGGILMVVGGFAGTVAGGVLVSSAKERIDIYCDGPFLCAHKDDDARKTAGGIIMAIGIVTGAAGIPLWIIGSKQIPIKKDAEKKQAALEPRLHVGPASAKLSVQF